MQNVILQPRRGIARCMLGSIHLQFVKNDQNNKTNINNTVCIASQKNIYRLYPPHSTSVNKEVIDDFGGNCNGDCVSEEKGRVLSSLYRIGIKREYPAEYKWQLHEAGTSRSQTYRKSCWSGWPRELGTLNPNPHSEYSPRL